MYKFIWVEIDSIDKNGEWLKVLKKDHENILCERKSIYDEDVYIHESDILYETSSQLF